MKFVIKNRSLTKNDLLFVMGYGNSPSRHEVLKRHTDLEKQLAQEALFYRNWLETFYILYRDKIPHSDMMSEFNKMFNGENG